MEAIESELKTIERSRVFFEPEAMATAGAVVGVEHGALRVERGLVRTADRAKAAEAVGGGAQAVTGGRVSEVPGRKTGQLPDVLARSLFGHRNLAAKSMTAANPHVAKVLLAAWMVQTLRNRPGAVPVDLRIVDAGFGGVGTRTQHPIVDESGAARQKAFAGIGNELVAALPKKEDALWDALMKLDAPELDRIIAFAVASALSLDKKHDGFTGQLLDALGFEMADHFTPTAENYFGRIPKALIVQALRDAGKAGSDAHRTTLVAMKKADLAALAEQDMTDSRWVPALVRGPKRKAAASGRKRPAAPAATARKSGNGTGAGSDDIARASRRKKASGRPADAAAGGKVRRSRAAVPPAPAAEDPSTERMAA